MVVKDKVGVIYINIADSVARKWSLLLACPHIEDVVVFCRSAGFAYSIDSGAGKRISNDM